ncbi:hypothetical protein D3C72_809820 [compost metagenome]
MNCRTLLLPASIRIWPVVTPPLSLASTQSGFQAALPVEAPRFAVLKLSAYCRMTCCRKSSGGERLTSPSAKRSTSILRMVSVPSDTRF